MDSYVIAAWLGGLLLGWFIVLHFIILGRGAGSSTGYACLVKKASNNLGKYGVLDPLKFFFILGLPLGGLIHALVVQQHFSWSFDMGMYETVLPDSDALKIAVLVLGGAFLGFGSRMAGGCTTGHVLAGGSVLNKASLVAGVIFFVSALVTVQLLFLGTG
ncbi:MAG: YeeE/YedE family protein [Cocleimonas sp.]|nr:YeeE/YedE family protein [Cocleimonas sp.]